MISKGSCFRWHNLCVAHRDVSRIGMNRTAADAPPLACDLSRKFVRVTDVRADGLVAFEFSIGWPEMAVELVLPKPAFEEFCNAHQVQRLDNDPTPAASDANERNP